jgi:hypothetical protein
MLNHHAIELEKLLLQRGLTINKGQRDWQIAKGNGKHVTYAPANGTVRLHDSSLRYGRGALRGSPETIACILEGLVT